MSNDLARFATTVIQNDLQRTAYLEDPAAAMSAAGLGAEEQAVMRSGNFRVMLEFLDDGGQRPVPPNQQPTGGGGGSGSG